MKDHEIALLVNELRAISEMYGHTEQLRSRISDCVNKALKEPAPVVERQPEPSLWLVRIPEEPEDPEESPAEYVHVGSTYELSSLLKRPGSTIDKVYFTSPPAPAALTDSFVQPVPDKCDRITWRGSYYHLPIETTATVSVVLPERKREDAYDEHQTVREYHYECGWNACLDKVKELNQ